MLEKISRGFATFAKSSKSGILPVAIIGSDTKPKWPFSNKLTVKVGKIITYSEDIESMMQQWCDSISSMTGKLGRINNVTVKSAVTNVEI